MLVFSLKAFPVVTRLVKQGTATQYSQTYQIDQDGAPSVTFTRTSMKDGALLPPGVVYADGTYYTKSVKNEKTGYSDEYIILSVKNLRVTK